MKEKEDFLESSHQSKERQASSRKAKTSSAEILPLIPALLATLVSMIATF